MGIVKNCQEEFFSKPVTVMFDERKEKEANNLVGILKKIGFSNVDRTPSIPDERESSIVIYHSGDVIHGERINAFLTYARWYANVA